MSPTLTLPEGVLRRKDTYPDDMVLVLVVNSFVGMGSIDIEITYLRFLKYVSEEGNFHGSSFRFVGTSCM